MQLNPNTTDAYESKTLAQMRQMVFDGLGFVNPLSGDGRLTIGEMRLTIINRLGLAVALLANTDSYTNIFNDVYNATGFAGQSSPPPGIANLLSTFINDAQRTLFARIEYDKGGVTPPSTISGSTQTSVDATAVRMLATALAKAHFGQPDAQAYGAQAEQYLKDLTQRTPPNIVGQINAALIDAHRAVFRRYEMGQTDMGAEWLAFGRLLDSGLSTGTLASTIGDRALTLVDGHPVTLLALANLKAKIGQPDAKDVYAQYEQYMADMVKRQPPNALTLVNSTLKMTQQTLYRKYDVFRNERWYTWSLVAGQRFYGTFGDDNANSLAPTGLTATQGASVVSHNLVKERYAFTANRLSGGTVLIAGGLNDIGDLNSAELFDPDTGTFALTGSMRYPRENAASVVLADGTVLVMGGFNGAVLSQAEIYDPATGTFTPTHSLNVARYHHTATVLQDGTVLVTGGVGSGGVVDSAEIFDPATRLFTTLTATLPSARSSHTATLLTTGEVLIAGGSTPSATTSAALYDPVAQTFTATGAMSVARAAHQATLLTNGNVLVTGGSGTPSKATAELYDRSTGTFSATGGDMTVGRYSHAAILLSNQKVLIAGGETTTASASTTAKADIYDPATGLFTATSNDMPVAISGAQPVELADDRILIAGGYSTGDTVATAMFYDPTTDEFTATGNLTQGTVYYQATAYTANGESSPCAEVFIAAVPANTAVDLSWTMVPGQPFVLGTKLYGRATGGTKKLIATIPLPATTYTDEGTIPPVGALPTVNATAGPGALDPRDVTWVGITFNDNVWNRLDKGIPPEAFASNIQGVPTHYEIRQSLELWPPPSSSDWKVQVKGYFHPMVFESDNDYTTLDWQAIYLRALADLKVTYKQPDAAMWEQRAKEYIGGLISGSHMTARYIPGHIQEQNAIRPKLLGPYIGYP